MCQPVILKGSPLLKGPGASISPVSFQWIWLRLVLLNHGRNVPTGETDRVL